MIIFPKVFSQPRAIIRYFWLGTWIMMRIQELRPIMLIALVLYDLLLLLISRSWNLAEDKFDGHFLKITSQF